MATRPPPPPADLAVLTNKDRARENLIVAMHIAAQVEHDLMVQYLYAAYSLGGEQAKLHPEFVRKCRDTLLAVAREEMGHLLTVQNILLFLGGPIALDRPPWSAKYQPYPLRLERFSIASLARYLHGESPAAKEDPRIRECLAGREEDLKAPEGIIGFQYKFFAAALKDQLPESAFDPASYAYQATTDEFVRGFRPTNAKPYALDSDASEAPSGRVIVAAVNTRGQAINALLDIASQGEGSTDEGSHYNRFKKLFDEFYPIHKGAGKEGWSPSWPVVDNPWAGEEGTRPPTTTKIPWGTAQHWAKLFNVRYRVLLSLLTYLFRVPRDGSLSGGLGRGQILGRLFGEMYNMKVVAGILVRVPVSDDPSKGSGMAGPPFQVPYSLGLPVSKENFWRSQLERLDEADDLAQRLLTPDYLGRSPAEGERYLRLMCEADSQARRWIEKILAGEGSLP